MDVNDMRRLLAALADQMGAQALVIDGLETVAGGAEPGALDAASAAFDDLRAQFKATEIKVERAEAVEAAQARTALARNTPAPLVSARAVDPNDKGMVFGIIAAGLMATRGDSRAAIDHLQAEGYGAVSAIMSTGSNAAGGFAMPAPVVEEVIALLRPLNPVRRAGARVINMPAGELRNARMATGASASYGVDVAATPASAAQLGEVSQAFKKLTALQGIGNSLLRYSIAALGGALRDDLVAEAARVEGIAFLRGSGTGGTPKGLTNWAIAAHIQESVALGAGGVNVEPALRRAIGKVTQANIPLVNPAWFMRSDVKAFLASLRDSVGHKVYPTIDDSNTLHGHKIEPANALPDNIGADGDASEIIFADMNEIIIGDALTIQLELTREGSYVDSEGATISATQRDLTIFRMICEHDLAPAHDEGIAVIQGRGWL
jgi:HK97 family phage major capsid protein